MQCSECGGSGIITKKDIFNPGMPIQGKCTVCDGTGLSPDTTVYDGVKISKVLCETFYVQRIVDGELVSTLEIRMYPGGICEIPRMHTVAKHRNNGYMKACMEAMLADKSIRRVESSWKDSNSMGRNFLLNQGFKQEGDKLVWVRK